jgi:UDPglucose 6-dehydrogenase
LPGTIARRRRLAERILEELPGRGPAKAAILAVYFKANTDDVRDSAALETIPTLLAGGVKVNAFDPWAPEDSHAARRCPLVP